MSKTAFDMERGIARCRVLLSLVAILALYIDPTEPRLIRWLPLTGGPFTVDRYWASVLIAHLAYSVTLFVLSTRDVVTPRLTILSTCGDVLFAAAIALVTEGATSPFYSFFAFAVLAAGMRSGRRAALAVTTVSVSLYLALLVTSAPPDEAFYVVMRAAYIGIAGYLVGYLGQTRIDLEARIRGLEASAQREQIARSLHDGYAQALAGVNLRVESCRELFRRGRHDEALAELADLQTGVNREHDLLREYIRSLVDLDAGERGPLRPDQTAMSIEIAFRGGPTLVEHVLLILLEATRNIRRHAHARSAAINVRTRARELSVTIDDDGVGFEAGAPLPWSIMSRVAECGGSMQLRKDGRPGAHVVIDLPAV
jgi:signal transduction histidine kinase